MFRFVYMLETNYASEISEHFWLWPSRKARQNQEINRILFKGHGRSSVFREGDLHERAAVDMLNKQPWASQERAIPGTC